MTYYADDDRDARIPERNFLARYNTQDDDDDELPPNRPPPPRTYEDDPRNAYPQQDVTGNRYRSGDDPRFNMAPHASREGSVGYGNHSRPQSAQHRPYTPDRRGGDRYQYSNGDPRYQERPHYEETFERGPVVPSDFNPIPGGNGQYEDLYRAPSTYHPEDSFDDQEVCPDERPQMRVSKIHIIIFFYCLLLLFSITQIIMGGVYLYRCPVDDFVPEWNLMTGGVTIVVLALIGILHLFENCRTSVKVPKTDPGERGRTAQSMGHFHKMAWVLLTVIQTIAWISGTFVIADKRPEFELERDNLVTSNFDQYDYDEQRTGRSRFYDAEIMNPEYCDPAIWVFTLVAVIVGWVYLVIMALIWIYFFCYRMDIDVTDIKPTEMVYLERQKSIQAQNPKNYNIYT